MQLRLQQLLQEALPSQPVGLLVLQPLAMRIVVWLWQRLR
jgi:hypothetical protein